MLPCSPSVVSSVRQTTATAAKRLCTQHVRCVATEAQYKWKIPPTPKAHEVATPQRIEAQGLKGKFAARPKKGVRDLKIETDFHVKVFRLCNAAAGNPLTSSLVHKLSEELTISNKAYNPTRLIVLINDVAEGADRTFSVGDPAGVSGGDGVETHYRDQYLLLNDLHNSRPVLAVMDGLAADAGAGLALSALFTMATNTSGLAVRSAGSMYVNGGVLAALTHLDHALAKYLALAAPTLSGADIYHTGLSNVYVPYERLGRLRDRLSDLASFDPLHINASLCEFMQLPAKTPSLGPHLDTVHKCFDNDKTTVEDIIVALEKEKAASNTFAEKTLEQLKSQPPVALKVTLRQMQQLFQQDADRQAVLQDAFQVAVAVSKYGPQHRAAGMDGVTDEVVHQFFRSKAAPLQLPAPVPWSVRQTTEVLSVDDVAAKVMPDQYQPKPAEGQQAPDRQASRSVPLKGKDRQSRQQKAAGDPSLGVISAKDVRLLMASGTRTEEELYRHFAETGQLQVPGNAALLAQYSTLLSGR